MADENVPVVTQTTPVVADSQPVEPVIPASPSSGDTTTVVKQAPDTTTDASAEPKALDGERQSTPEPGKKLNPISERISDLVTERNAAKEYAEYWRQKTLEMMRANPVQPTPPSQQTVQQPQVPGEAPTLEQHNYDQSAWAKAMSDWADRKADYRFQQNLSTSQVRQAQTDVLTNYNERVDNFKKDHPDFDIVSTNPRLPQLHPVAAAMVLSSDLGADLTYHLATNVDEAVRIAKLPPPKQANAIGELAAELRQARQPKVVTTIPAITKPEPTTAATSAPVKPAPVVATTSQAPEPPTPIASGGPSEVNPNNLSVGDWMRLRVDQTRGRRRGGRVATTK